MNTVSCSGCGIVLNKDVLKFPDDIYTVDYWGGLVVDKEKAVWNGEDYVPFVKCPLCSSKVKKEDNNEQH